MRNATWWNATWWLAICVMSLGLIACSGTEPQPGWETQEEFPATDAGNGPDGGETTPDADELSGPGSPGNPGHPDPDPAFPDGDAGWPDDAAVSDSGDTALPEQDGGPSGGGEAGLGETCESTLDCDFGLECTDQSMDVRTCEQPSCHCNDPNTFCLRGECAIADRNCVLDGCPDDYSCEEKTCVCDDRDACASGCSVDDDCEWDQICNAGSCADAYCETDAECPADYVCGGSQSYRLCRPAGGGQVGDDCYNHSDCATGYCYGGVTCVEPCLTNADCPTSRECASPDHFDLMVPYCRAPECGGCSSNAFCRAPTYVDNQWTCTTEDACPGGDCSVPFEE